MLWVSLSNIRPLTVQVIHTYNNILYLSVSGNSRLYTTSVGWVGRGFGPRITHSNKQTYGGTYMLSP